MNIAVNTVFLWKRSPNILDVYATAVLQSLVNNFPQHRFTVFCEEGTLADYTNFSHVQVIRFPAGGKQTIIQQNKLAGSIKAEIKRLSPDVILSMDEACSLNVSLPQCILVNGYNLKGEKHNKRLRDYIFRRKIQNALKKAGSLIVGSEKVRELLVKQALPSAKIYTIPGAGRSAFQPTEFSKQLAFKDMFTDSKEFFLYRGPILPQQNLLHLFKAFSMFKKRQKSNMKLVLTGPMLWNEAEFSSLLQTYKYRNDVTVLPFLGEPEQVNAMNAAYALVQPSLYEPSAITMLEAFQCGIPVLSSSETAYEEAGREAVLYFDGRQIDDIADKMMLIYKDEKLRSELVAKGKEIAGTFTWQETSLQLIAAVEAAIK